MSNSPELKDIAVALSTLKWSEVKSLAVQLGMTLHILSQIEERYTDLSERTLHSMQEWLQNDVEPSWAKMVAALRNIGQNAVATAIEQKYCQSMQTVSIGANQSTDVASNSCCSLTTSISEPSVDPPSSQALISAKPSSLSTPGPQVETSCSYPLSPSLSSSLSETNTTQLQDLPGQHGVGTACPDPARIERVAAGASQLQEQFMSLLTSTKIKFSGKRRRFLNKLQMTLTTLPVSHKFKHLYFSKERGQEIMNAKSVSEIFFILEACSYWNYTDFYLLEHLIQKFGGRKLRREMKRYVTALEHFEKSTTINDIVDAKLDNRQVPHYYRRAELRLGKNPSECTLYDVRKFVESLSRRSSLNPYAMLVSKVGTSSVMIMVAFPYLLLEIIIGAMDRRFLQSKHIISVIIDEKLLEEYDEKYIKGLQLLRASGVGDDATVHSLLHSGVSPDFTHKNGVPALHWASNNGCKSVVEVLLAHGANVHSAHKNGWTALHLASCKGHTDVVELLLDHEADIHAVNKNQQSALHIASVKGHLQTVRLLLERGAEPSRLSLPLHGTALHLASSEGHIAIIALLLDYGADIHSVDKNQQTSLHWASLHGQYDTMQLLLERGADPNKLDGEGRTALILAVEAVYAHAVEVLVCGGADLNVQDEYGLTALMWAALSGYHETVNVLVQCGANLNAQNKDGLTALMIAVIEGQTTIVSTLVEGHADINVPENSTSWTALFFAAKGGHLEITRMLVGAGANVLLKDKNGVTALDVARVRGKEEVHEVLLAVQPEETSRPPPDQQATHPTTHVHAPIEPTPSSPDPTEHTPQTLRSLVNISVQRITDVYQALQRRLKSTPTKELLQQKVARNQDERENIHENVHIITPL